MRQFLIRISNFFGSIFKVDMNYAVKSGFWVSMKKFIELVAAFALSVAFANLLPKETYGSYRYIMSIAASFSFLTLVGMKPAVSQAVARGYERAFPESMKIQLKFGIFYFIAALGAAAYYYLQNDANFAIAFLILSVTYPLTQAFSTYGAYLVGKRDFKRQTLFSGINTFVHLGLVITAISISNHVLTLIAVYTVTNLVMTAILSWHTLRGVKKQKTDEAQKKALVNYGSNLTVINVLGSIVGQIDKIILFNVLGPVQLAIYTFATDLPEFISGFIKEFVGIAFPKLAAQDIKEIKRTYYLRLFQCLLIGSALALVYILFAPLLFRIFFPEYLDAVWYSQLLALHLILVCPGTYGANVLRAKKYVKTLYVGSIVPNLLRLVLYTTFGIAWGILGLIIAKIGVQLFALFFVYIFLWEKDVARKV